MYKKHKLFLLLFALILISTTVSAIEGSLKLLAVAESENGFTGKIANLNLEIIKGKGRVFLDTFPLTKFDTQISTRFAKQISCDFLEVDCSGYDFIYTINSDSGIIGGPSAGAATAVLTTALLKGLKLNPKIAMTGTINSGGLIGPVSGLFKKIEAAGTNGITIVLIPRGTRYVNINEAAGEEIGDLFNKTEIDLVEFGVKQTGHHAPERRLSGLVIHNAPAFNLGRQRPAPEKENVSTAWVNTVFLRTLAHYQNFSPTRNLF